MPPLARVNIVAGVVGESVGEVLEGLWRFEALHPEWTEEEGGEDGWEQQVAWWAVASAAGVVLIDPLVEDWQALDRLVDDCGGCAAVVRTIHWHQRNVAEAATRYGAEVWAKPHPDAALARPLDRAAVDRQELIEGIRAFELERGDEIAVWLPVQSALLFGDAMLRRESGELRVCPESWLQPEGGAPRLRSLLRGLAELSPEHVLVCHGPLVLGNGRSALESATVMGTGPRPTGYMRRAR